ncbi:MAG: TRL domain-containing protein [Leptospirillia bacterium]
MIYKDLTVGSPLKDNPNSTSLQRGEACSTSIIGFQTDGDSSTQTAMKNGGIKSLVSVKHHITSVLGIYTKVCTIAKGK